MHNGTSVEGTFVEYCCEGGTEIAECAQSHIHDVRPSASTRPDLNLRYFSRMCAVSRIQG
jgi:hypothetical protein